KRSTFTLKNVLAFVGMLAMGATATNVAAYNTPGHNSGSCSSNNNIQSVFTSGGLYNISKINSGCGSTTGYTYYSSPGTQALVTRQGANVTLSIKNGNPALVQNCKVWIDFNHDNSFTSTEQVYYSPIAAAATNATGISIPTAAAIATTRMRIRLSAALSATTGPDDLLTGGESEDYDVNILSQTIPDCDTVTNFQVTNQTLTGATITWNPPAGGGAVRYETHISRSPNPPTTGSGYNPVNTPSVTTNALMPSTCYYLHVRTNCDPVITLNAESKWTTYKFCTVQDCDAPKVTIDRITGTTAVATWDPVPTVYAYEYAVATTATPPVAGTITTSTAVQLLGLAPNKGLYFHIRSKCNPTPESVWKTVPFHTTVGTGVDDVNGGLDLDVYPNPVQNMLYITLGSKIADAATVTLTNITGKVVYQGAIKGDMQIDMIQSPEQQQPCL
ncbi:MAG: T9SS type A sorting domain-containing protein, partial [Sphingobacteriales bacterium]